MAWTFLNFLAHYVKISFVYFNFFFSKLFSFSERYNNIYSFIFQTKDAILKNKEKIRYLLVTRQSKSKRLFLYNPKKMVESNTNLVGYADRHKHYELFKKEGFVMPKGGIKAGLKGQLVILEKQKQTDHDNSSEDEEDGESIILH